MNYRYGFSDKERREARDGRQNAVEKDIREKAKNFVKRDTYNKSIREKGKNWFYSGKSLEEGLALHANNTNFYDGWNEALRERKSIELIEEDYNKGITYFMLGISKEDIPEYDKNKPHILRGYSDAMNGCVEKSVQSRSRR